MGVITDDLQIWYKSSISEEFHSDHSFFHIKGHKMIPPLIRIIILLQNINELVVFKELVDQRNIVCLHLENLELFGHLYLKA